MTEVSLSGHVMFVYHYNADNRLIKVEDGNNNTIAEYYYDPFGRRLWKDIAGTRSYFFYSDEGLVAEFDASGSEIRSYGYKPDSTWTTDPLWLKHNNAYYFYHNDHLGTPQKLTAQNGMVVWSASHSAFGEASVEIETVTNNLRFPGQYFDAETGLHCNFQRYYDPGIGRYISVDPIGFGGRDVNFYSYARNNSVKNSDSSGLYPATDGHGSIIPPAKSVWLLDHLQEAADAQLDFTIKDIQKHPFDRLLIDPPYMLSYDRNIYRLHFITGLPQVIIDKWPHRLFDPRQGVGGVISHRKQNKFVYTCKWGWIDHGHFFYNAFSTYVLGKGMTALVAELNELKQTVQGDASAYSPEDKTSNWLGRQFGKRMWSHDLAIPGSRREIIPASFFFDVAQEWKQFLKDAGAIKWGIGETTGACVKDMLDNELARYAATTWGKKEMYLYGTTVIGNQKYKEQQPEWRCLCDGPIPRDKNLRF